MHNSKNKPQCFLLIKDGSLRFIRSLVSLSNCSVMQTSGSEQQRQTSLTWRTCAEHCFMACFLKSVYYSVRLRKDAAGPYKCEFVLKTVQTNKTHGGNLKGSAMPAVPAGFPFRRIRSELQQSLIQSASWASLCLSCALDSLSFASKYGPLQVTMPLGGLLVSHSPAFTQSILFLEIMNPLVLGRTALLISDYL